MEEKDIDKKAIRTYESDIADAIQHRQTSQVSMTMAEDKKRREDNNAVVMPSEKKPMQRNGWLKNILMILASILLLIAGAAIAYYLYSMSPLSAKQPSTLAATSSAITVAGIITPDIQKIVDISGESGPSIVNQIETTVRANPLPNGGILEFVFGMEASTTQNSRTASSLTRVTGAQFISTLGMTPPDELISSLTDQWMFGIYYSADNASGTSPVPFIILTNNFFQNAFAGMLKWEPTMGSDLANLFGLQTSQWSNGQFQDKTIKNKDAREFTDADGNVLFIYSFIDNNTLVIAGSEGALAEIITRFENQAYVR